MTTDCDVVRGFLGCLMAGTAGSARELLAGMRPTDAGPGIRGVVLELIVSVVTAGAAPDPRVLLAEARRRGLLDTEHKYQQFALWLFETYQHAPVPEAGHYLRGAVLEGAFRRRVREHAQRLLDAAERAEVTELRAMTELDDDLVDLWQRYDAATTEPSTAQAEADHRKVPTIAATDQPQGRAA
ncbi:hypothetical protein [Saccharopolyspora thermophila]|uniref:Uncharacterized protein n=1 Tax=Saccharopolyspora thermophila TaxID=89367 RepID=A0ABN1C304_9PSEU